MTRTFIKTKKNGTTVKIETVDIWSNVYITCLQGYLEEIGKIAEKTLYRSIIRNRYYFLTDSRYGENFYL